MKRSRLSYILITVMCSVLSAHSLTSRGDSNLPGHPPAVSLEFSLPGGQLEARVPIVARVILTNSGSEPITLRMREEGTPYTISLVTVNEDGEEKKSSLWLRRSGPSTHDVTLAPDEHISGEILLLDRDKGLAFDVPGRYRVWFRWTSEDGRENVYADELQVDALVPQEQNATCLKELQDLAIDFYATGAASARTIDPADMGDARVFYGNKLLSEIIGQRKPLSVYVNGRSADQHRGKLTERLEDLLSRHPNSSYSGYIARYLGLLHIHAVADEFSLGRHEVRANAEHPSLWDGTACRADPSYKKSLQYLTKADKSDLWPRTTAIGNLAVLHMVAQEWDKADACLTKLRAKYAESHGVQRADELERHMAKYKAKLARRKGTAP